MARVLTTFIALVLGGCWNVSPADHEANTEDDASTDSDSDNDADADTDVDTDVDGDTDTGTNCGTPWGWYDASTGLCWENPPPTEMFAWDDAVAYCDGPSLGGFDDWRLPMVQELISLLRGCVNGTATGDMSTSECGVTDPACLEDGCWDYPTCSSCGSLAGPDDNPDGCYWDPALAGVCFYYWSSSSHASDVSDAWAVGFAGGDVGHGAKSGTFYYRCVRGGP